ncbi:MAG: putative diguanylate cyclase YegE [Syntrophus sp. PtaU1.Bin208]|nr:MAG: putative diguanylate cyclase YegE [Syntrophus sp. PtaU1.Bin208]
MDDWKKTKAHLIRELEELRARVAGYESIEQRQKLTQKKQKKKENSTLRNASLVDIMAGSALSLLTCPNISEAVDQALAILGEGANVDRVYLFENHQDPCTGELLASQRFEWSKAGIISQRDNLLLINQPYRNFFPRWQSELPLGRSIKGLIEDFPAAEREFLAAQGILSLLVVPVMIEGRFWGFIGFDDCHEEKEWTKEEESILVAAAGNIVNAIERKRTEEALRKSEDQYRTIFENTGTPLLIFEKDTTICLVNAEFERAFHYSRDEVEGRMSWMDITLPEDLEWLKRYHYARRVDPGASPRNYELRVVDRFGHIHESYITIAMIPGTKRSIASVLDITPLKAVENALRESEAHYRTLFEHTGVAIVHVNPQGNWLRANENFLKFIGYTWEELEKINARDVTHPDYIEQTAVLIEKQINGEIDRFSQEKYYVRKDGVLRWGEMRSTPIRDERGRLLSAVVAIIDRTQQKQAEDRLKKYLEEMEDLYENAPFGYHSLGEDGKILRMNDTELSWLGYSCNEVIGKKYIDFVAPEGRDLWQQLFFLLQNRGRMNDIENKLIRKDGTLFPVLLNATAIYDEKGKYQMSRSSVLDNTERKRAEIALAEGEALYRNLFESALIGMFQSTLEGRFLRINQAYATMLGYESPAEVISTITDTATQIHADPRNRAELLAAVDRDGWFYAEQPYLRKDGGVMIGKLSVRKVVKGDGVSAYLEGIVEDITERKKTEKALQESERELRVKATRLGEANMALKVLLKSMESDQEEFRERILTNIRDQVLPYLDKLKHSPLNEFQRDYVQTSERNLKEIASPFLKKIASGCFNLTMKETQIASLVRDGKTSKEIAGLLNVSQRVIDFHRKNIRKKLGLTERGESLVMLLRSLS